MQATAQLIIAIPSAADAQRFRQAMDDAALSHDAVDAPDRESLLSALERGGFDVLLASPDQIHDQAFMAAVRGAAPDMAVIAVGESMDGSRCMELVEAGATCCLGTDELDRLASHVVCCMRMGTLLLERRRYREGMAEFQARFNHLFENSPDGLVILDDAHRIVEANESFLRMFRYAQQEIAGLTLGEVIVPDDLQEEYRLNAASVMAGNMVRTETLRIRKDGSPVHVAVQGCPIMIQEGMIGAYAGYTDITSRIRALEALRRAESKYRSIFENAVEGMYISTPFGRFVTVNKAMSDLLGYDSPSDLTDNVKSIRREIYAEPGMRDEFRRRIETTGTVAGFASRVRRKDGVEMHVMENVRAVHDDDGDLLYFQGTMQALPDPTA